MIPLKLRLKNFMCYREDVPPLNFEGIHLACLCGDNGHGKSALLDALTWALWGQARARNDDDLISLGEMEMEVELEFLVGQGRCRVLRKRAKGRRPGQPGESLLDLQMARDSAFQSIAGNSLRETQRKIVDLLRMDYDTFINSSLLLQGRADEFTRRRPGERKDVLARILGLALYDKLEAMARDRHQLQKARESSLREEIEALGRELAHLEEYEAEFQQAQTNLGTLEEVCQAQEKALASLRMRKGELDLRRQELEQLEARMRQEEPERRTWAEQAQESRRRLQAFQDILSQAAGVEAGYQELAALRQEVEGFHRKLQKLLALNQRRGLLERAIDQARGELLAQQRLAQAEWSRLEALAARGQEAEAEFRELRERLEALGQQEREVNLKRSQVGQVGQEAARLQSLLGRCREEVKELQTKLSLLEGEEARCPLCQRLLSDEDRHRLKGELQAQVEAREREGRGLETAILKAEAEHRSREGEIALLEARLSRDKAAAQARTVALEGEISQGEEAQRRASGLRRQVEDIAAHLGRGDFALKEQEELRSLEAELRSLGYDEAQHSQVRARMEKLAPYEERFHRLREAERLRPQEEAALSRAQGQEERYRASLEGLARKREALRQELLGMPGVAEQLSGGEAALSNLSERRKEATYRLGAAQEKVKSCQSQAQVRAGKEEEMRRAAWEKGIYEELALAFGQRGLQAMLIEQALPEVEAEANRLLASMTEGRMHLKLEAQRPRRGSKGDPIETLDILIADELGTRNYEMYSGGEAFRINLALRIALSRLLARRAGAPLSILVIDEGFGTQDASNLDRVVEAIASIQEEFEKILVVTHIQELKELFPVRIEVVKTERGSTFTLT